MSDEGDEFTIDGVSSESSLETHVPAAQADTGQQRARAGTPLRALAGTAGIFFSLNASLALAQPSSHLQHFPSLQHLPWPSQSSLSSQQSVRRSPHPNMAENIPRKGNPASAPVRISPNSIPLPANFSSSSRNPPEEASHCRRADIMATKTPANTPASNQAPISRAQAPQIGSIKEGA